MVTRQPGHLADPVSLLADDLTIARGGRVVLANVTIRARGGVVAILGPNGSGKTSLLRALATVAPPKSGMLRIDGRDPMDREQRVEIRRTLGYAPQAMRFHPRTRVFDAIDFVATLRLASSTVERQRETWRVLEMFDLSPIAAERLGRLSEGNRRRVTLAQGLLGPPRYAVFDEPLVALDPEIRLRAQEALADLGRSCTIVMASHLVNEAAEFADQVVVLGDGSPVFTGTPAELVAQSPIPGATAAHGYLSVRRAMAEP